MNVQVKTTGKVLDFFHGCNIHGLDKILKLCHLTQLFDGNLVILHCAHDLEFVDSVADRNQLGGTPHQAIHLNAPASFLHCFHVSSSQGFTSKRTEVSPITLGFFAFFLFYAFSLSTVILSFSSSSSSSSDPKRSTSSSSSSAGTGADLAGPDADDGFPFIVFKHGLGVKGQWLSGHQ